MEVVADIASEIASLSGALNTVTARLVEVVADAIAAGETDEAGMKTPAAWLAWRSGLSPEHAGQIVRLAKARERYPLLFDAFARGEVSADQMTELVKAPDWAQRQMLAFSEIGTVTRLRRAIRDSAFERDPDAPVPTPHEQAANDRLSFGVRDGRWRITGNLPIDLGREVEAAMVESKDRQFAAGDTEVTWVGALVDVAQRSMAGVESADRRDRYRVWFHVGADGAMTTTDGWRIPESIATLLLCDCVAAPVWERHGTPLSVGRAQHIVPDRTRRIIERRDRGCRVPGCTADRFVEVHHIVHWSRGGATDTWNLISLCPKHHRMHHHDQLGITGNADDLDGVEFTDARGAPIARSHPPNPPNEPPRCDRPYAAPPAGRMNYDWVGLGWAHPNALAQRREQANSWHQP